jgi:hypothetical protein
MMDGASRIKKSGASATSFPIDAVRLTGPDRVTSAVAIRATVKNGVWTIDLDSLNFPATGLFSIASELDLGGALPPSILGGGGGGGKPKRL